MSAPVAALVINPYRLSAPNVPLAMQQHDAWCHWIEEPDKDGKPTKVPYIAGSNRRAATNDPKTLVSFDKAVQQLTPQRGLGYVFLPDTHRVFIDLDNSVDLETGKLAIWAQRIVEQVPTYAEFSPSRKGIHIYGISDPLPKSSKKSHCELYSAGRFATITGDKLPGSPADIVDVNVDWLFRLNERDVFNFKRYPDLEQLMLGNWGGKYESQSEADLALCSYLSHLLDDPADIDRVVRLSGLYRSKWDERRGNSTYGRNNILRAMQSAPAVSMPALVRAGDSPTFSDDWIASQVIEQRGSDIRFSAGSCFLWDGTRWKRDATNALFDLVRGICRDVARSAEPAKAKSICSAHTMSAVVKIVSADAQLAIDPERWDANPFLLNTPVGTVDLCSGKLSPHRREDFLTKMTLVGPSGDCPLWLTFLDRVTASSSALQSFLQRVFGYCLTGDVREQVLFFLYGLGANGKSVFVNTLCNLLGDYATSVPIEVFMATGSDRHPTEIASMFGARVVSSFEVESGKRWAESRIKALTGGDKVSARWMRADFFSFRPTAKLLISGNHRPGLRSVDEAIRRRFRLIPFTVVIPPNERDLRLAEKLQQEWAGILAWAVAGCLEWQRQGLNPPEVALLATDSYLADEDVISRFVEERCILDDSFCSATSLLYAAWRDWMDFRGENPGSIRSFSQSLETVGLMRHRSADVRGFRGIALRNDKERSR